MILDIVILLLLALGAWKGWRSGALSMFLSVVFLIVAGVAASAFAHQAGELLRIGPAFARTVIGFLFLFIVFLIAGSFIKKAIRPKHGLLRGLDGIIGLVFGLIRSAFILSVLLITISLTHLLPESQTSHSVLYTPILKTSTPIVGVFKKYIREGNTTPAEPV